MFVYSWIFLKNKKFKSQDKPLVIEGSLFSAQTVKYRHFRIIVASAFKNGSYTHIAARSIITQTKYLSHFIN